MGCGGSKAIHPDVLASNPKNTSSEKGGREKSNDTSGYTEPTAMTKEGTFAAFEITDDAPKKKGKLPPRLEAQRKAKERKPEMKATDVEAKLSEAGKRREAELGARVSKQKADEQKRLDSKRAMIAKKRQGKEKMDRKSTDAESRRESTLKSKAATGEVQENKAKQVRSRKHKLALEEAKMEAGGENDADADSNSANDDGRGSPTGERNSESQDW
eukprot:m.138758 g.138758  ORF g.138758 m.138758 type:complete len:215 (+) comp22737_c0_seq8:636-1280(+)